MLLGRPTGHSAACGLVHAAAGVRPDGVAHVVHVAGFPSADGEPIMAGFTVVDGGLPFPGWDAFDDAELRDLDDDARARLTARLRPAPGAFATEPVGAGDDRRYALPTTVVSTEYDTTELHRWIEAGEPPVQEFRRLTDVRYVDLPTGHWPMFTRPADLARVITDAVGGDLRRPTSPGRGLG